MRRTIWVAALAALVGAAVAAPVAVLASHSFTDVADTNIFHADIDWLKDSGVTKGCNPPANTEFCPKDVVTRETMAAFLHRLALNKVVDAATAVEAERSVHAQDADHARSADSATSAQDADTVDGKHAAEFLGSTETAVDSDKVDGKHATDFLGSTETAVDSDKVDGKHANELTRVALGSEDQLISLTETSTTYGSVTIEAPQDGFVLLTAGVTIQNDPLDLCLADCEVTAVLEHVAESEISEVSQVDAAAGSQQAIPVTWVFPIQAGSQLFELQLMRLDATSGAIQGRSAQITALYSPFGAFGDPFPNLSGSS